MAQISCYRKWMKAETVNNIFAALDNEARFVGGSVRDALLGIDAKDIDIATIFHPDEVIRRLGRCGIKIIPTGIKHGTVTAFTSDGNFEITTLRRDIDCFGRHAKVEFTDNWQQDAARRDFTINAMSCNQDGEIFDYFGGREDLKVGKVCFVGDAGQRCKEDYLRILRFFRFSAYYGKPPVDVTALLACRQEAGGIDGLSGERVQTEMFKLLSAPSPVLSLQLMLENNVIGFVLQDVTESDIMALDKLLKLQLVVNNPIIRLAALLGDNFTAANNIATRWKLSNLDKSRLVFLCDPNNRIPRDASEKIIKKLLRKWGKEKFLDICHISFARDMDKNFYNKLISLSDWNIPVFNLSGKDLRNMGTKESKFIGETLKAVEIWWEENDYMPDKEMLLKYAVERLKRLT